MTTERKILIALGSLIVAGMIAVACFSLGVYVGTRGWTLKQPSLAGPQPPNAQPGGQPRPGQPQPGQPGQPGGGQPQPNAPTGQQSKPTLIGVVRRVDGNSLTVHAEGSPRLIALTERTKYAYRTPEGEIVEARLEDIEVGNGVAVFGPFSPDGRTLVADAVVVLPR
jgi:hypothetical protein